MSKSSSLTGIIKVVKEVPRTVKSVIHGFLVDFTDLVCDVITDIPDMRSLPKKFDYSYCLIAYFWSVVFMSSRTLGHRLAHFLIINSILNDLFNDATLVILTYVLLPAFFVFVDKEYSLKEISIIRRRIALIILAFIMGLFSEHVWIHWVHSSNVEPSYYFPFIVGLSFQVSGPVFKNNRILLWLFTVGFGSILSLVIAAKMHILGIKYLIGALVCTAQSTINFQMLIGELRRAKIDENFLTTGQLKSLLISVYTHAFLTLLNAEYDPLNFNTTNII